MERWKRWAMLDLPHDARENVPFGIAFIAVLSEKGMYIQKLHFLQNFLGKVYHPPDSMKLSRVSKHGLQPSPWNWSLT